MPRMIFNQHLKGACSAICFLPSISRWLLVIKVPLMFPNYHLCGGLPDPSPHLFYSIWAKRGFDGRLPRGQCNLSCSVLVCSGTNNRDILRLPFASYQRVLPPLSPSSLVPFLPPSSPPLWRLCKKNTCKKIFLFQSPCIDLRFCRVIWRRNYRSESEW